MAHIDQFRSFQQRLNDFGPELGGFLDRVWAQRSTITLNDFETGTNAIYGLYSGAQKRLKYDSSALKKFVKDLLGIAGKYPIHPQGFDCLLSDFSNRGIEVYGKDLWTDFFHVLSVPQRMKAIRSRVYVHAANSSASIQLMKVIINQFGKNQGLWEVKTAGPGSLRLDTIVAYLYDTQSADALVRTLKEIAQSYGGRFIDSLPPLVRREAAGIGSADEPPAIEVYSKSGTQFSFGSFYSALCWVALKATPNVGSTTADGRHMLDNMLYSLRLLRVDPRNPQRFPEASALEAWYQASVK